MKRLLRVSDDSVGPCGIRRRRSLSRRMRDIWAGRSFNSAIYVIAWPSLKDLVARKGQMRLVCSPVLPPQDIEAIDAGYSVRFEEENAQKMREDIRYMLAAPYLHKPTAVLAALIGMGDIDVRIAFMK